MNVKPALYRIAHISANLAFLCILSTTTAVMAAIVTLRWDPNAPAPKGYRVFARKSDQAYDYSRPDWQGTATICTLDNLENQTEYYFVVRA